MIRVFSMEKGYRVHPLIGDIEIFIYEVLGRLNWIGTKIGFLTRLFFKRLIGMLLGVELAKRLTASSITHMDIGLQIL